MKNNKIIFLVIYYALAVWSQPDKDLTPMGHEAFGGNGQGLVITDSFEFKNQDWEKKFYMYRSNGVSWQFKMIFDDVILALEKINPSLLPDVHFVRKLKQLRERVIVYAVPYIIFWDSVRELDAINYPSENPPKIMISTKSWIKLNLQEKRLLVLHEILPSLGYVDFHYKYSNRLKKIIDQAGWDPYRERLIEIANYCHISDIDFLVRSAVSTQVPKTWFLEISKLLPCIINK